MVSKKALLCSWLLLALPMFAEAAAMKSIVGDQVNVRSGPGKKHEVRFKANLGYPVQIEQQQGAWIRIKDWLGERGWVTKEMVGVIPLLSSVGRRPNQSPRR